MLFKIITNQIGGSDDYAKMFYGKNWEPKNND